MEGENMPVLGLLLPLAALQLRLTPDTLRQLLHGRCIGPVAELCMKRPTGT